MPRPPTETEPLGDQGRVVNGSTYSLISVSKPSSRPETMTKKNLPLHSLARRNSLSVKVTSDGAARANDFISMKVVQLMAPSAPTPGTAW
ncbi:hypothetical protein D3C76_1760950 [compost metagenome]